jgi:hypothetical protein
MVDDIAPLSFVERVARLEERMISLITLLDEIRRDQKELADVVARASGGLRMLLLLGGLVGFLGALRSLMGWAGGLLPHISGSST